MNLLRPVDHPRARSSRSWAFDVALTALVAVVSLPDLLRTARPWPLELGVLLLMVAPLLLRRVWPTPVFGWIYLVAVLVAGYDVRLVAAPALVVALFTVAAWRPRRETQVGAVVLEVTVVVAAAEIRGSDWWVVAIFLSAMVAAAVGLGLYAGTRRAYLAELRDRAARLERERDQQGALAAAAERARIAREMHDIVAHHLTVMVALSDGAAAASATSPGRAADAMRTVSATGRQALSDTRRLLGVLRNGDAGGIDGIDGSPAAGRQPVPDLADLDDLVAGVRAAGLPVSFEVQGAAGALPSGVQLAVYRLVQEALTNTLKHGGVGARAAVRLRYLPGEVRVDVEDDGAGPPKPTTVGVGRGLTGMRERVAAFDGEVQSGPRVPGGWRVSARLPTDDVVPA